MPSARFTTLFTRWPEGIACILISSEIEEVIGLCTRVVVMREGRITGILSGAELTEEESMYHANRLRKKTTAARLSSAFRPRGTRPRMKKKFDFTKFAPLVALIILVVISAFASEHFLKIRNLLNILRQVSYTGVIGLGMTFVIISGGIDLSVGSMVAFIGGTYSS